MTKWAATNFCNWEMVKVSKLVYLYIPYQATMDMLIVPPHWQSDTEGSLIQLSVHHAYIYWRIDLRHMYSFKHSLFCFLGSE